MMWAIYYRGPDTPCPAVSTYVGATPRQAVTSCVEHVLAARAERPMQALALSVLATRAEHDPADWSWAPRSKQNMDDRVFTLRQVDEDPNKKD